LASWRLPRHRTRKPEMKAFTLPKEDVDALVAYLGR
jgi:hypothetical protein